MRVLITRPEPDADAFAEVCRNAGLSPVIAPLMVISFLRRSINLDNVGALAFTSANGVRALTAATERRDLPVFAVGAATGKYAKDAGFDNVSIADGEIKSLTTLFTDGAVEIKGKILHIAGAHRAGDLVKDLSRRGFEARREVLYEARAVDTLPERARAALVGEPPVEWAAFFSPRTASLFVALLKKSGIEGKLGQVRAACLSEAVAQAIAKAGWKSIEVASQRDADAIVKTIIEFEGQNRA